MTKIANYCATCGKPLAKENKFCAYCGTAVSSACLFGFFNGKHIFLLSGLAVLIGAFTGLLLVTEDYNGWEYFSAVMSLVLYALFGIVVGTIVEIVLFTKNKRKMVTNQDGTPEKKTTKWPLILVIVYVVLLIVPVVTSLSALEPAADKYDPVPGVEEIPGSISVNKVECAAEARWSYGVKRNLGNQRSLLIWTTS